MTNLLRRKRRHDIASWLVLAVTVVLFAIALIEKGFTHDILLEAGVFLVSIKVILGAQQVTIENEELKEKIDQVLSRMDEKSSRRGGSAT